MRWLRHPSFAILLVALAAPATLAGEPTPPAAPPAAPAALVHPAPIAELFKPLLYRYYSLSPDGRYLGETALVDKADADRVEQVRDIADLKKLRLPDQTVMVTDLKTRKYLDLSADRAGVWISNVHWLDARSFAWHVVDRRRGEYRIDVNELGEDAEGNLAITRTRTLGKNAYLLDSAPSADRRLLVGVIDGDGETVYRIDAKQPIYLQLTPANRIAGPFRGVQHWAVDLAGEVRAVGLHRRGDMLRILVRDVPGGPWRTVVTLPDDDTNAAESSHLVGIMPGSDQLLVITDRGTDKKVLREVDPKTGKLGRIVIGDSVNDVSAVLRDPRDDRVVGALLNDNETRTRYIDAEVERMQAEAAKLLPRWRPRVINYSADRQHAIVFTGQSDDPGRYYYLALGKGKPLLIETAAPWLDGRRLARSQPIELKARDGLTIHGQFTPPLDPAAKPPLVVMPHGGPFGIRDYLYYDPDVQFLASRGYAVLQVDFRGSGGYGREFMQAGFGRWGKEMQFDLLDALDHVAAKGWVDAQRVCVYGASYGGYAAMMSIIQQPQRFRCGVTYAGVSDLTLLFRSDELHDAAFIGEALTDFLRKAIGDPEKEKAELQARSPAYIGKGIQRPVLIAHGDSDTRAEPEHAWRLRSAIEAGGGKPEWIMAKGEGHGFKLKENVQAFYTTLEAFLAKHLGAAAPAPATASR